MGAEMIDKNIKKDIKSIIECVFIENILAFIIFLIGIVLIIYIGVKVLMDVEKEGILYNMAEPVHPFIPMFLSLIIILSLFILYILENDTQRH